MGFLDFVLRKIKGSRHENHTSHTQKSSKSNKTDTSYQSEVTNNGSSRGHPQDPQNARKVHSPRKIEHRNENSGQPHHVHKTPYSIEKQIKYIEKHIYDWNKENPPSRHVKIDIIILQGLLDINQNLTEPRSSSQIRFICNPEKVWGKLNSELLQIACKERKWHPDFLWSPYDLDEDVQKRMFKEIAKDDPVYKTNKKVMIIRGPPQDYRICQRIDRLRGWESKPDLYNSKLSRIVEDIESYINSNKKQLEDTRSKSKKFTITPRVLIKKWQKDYHFEFSKVLRSLKNNSVERSKPSEHSGTKSHESHKVDGPRDSAISLPNTGRRALSKSKGPKPSNHGSESDTSISTRPRRVHQQHNSAVSPSGAGERPPSKSRAHKLSDDVSDSDPSIHPRRRKPKPSQPLIPSKPQTKSNRDNLAKTAPHTRPSITIQSPSKDGGRSSSKSPHRKLHGRSPRTPRTPQTPLNKSPGKPSLPPSLYQSDHGRQKSPARPRSSDRRIMTQERSHRDFLDPITSQSQSQSYPHANSNEVRPRNSYPDLFNNNPNYSQQQQNSNSQLLLPYVNTKYGYPRPSNEDTNLPSPPDAKDMSWKDGRTREQIEEIHRQEYKKLRSEDGIS
ncbi:hypothetical protein EAE99_007820 [Botrytis elliptica]|nr:hypothetical protein EAE99_007820 [Botrytis elliptica]